MFPLSKKLRSQLKQNRKRRARRKARLNSRHQFQFEMLEDRRVLTTLVGLDGSGNLLIEDVDADSSNDQLTLELSGANLVVRDAGNTVTAGSGVSQVDPNSVSVPLVNITGAISAIGLGGNDTYTLDNLYPASGIPQLSIDGGNNDDTVIVSGPLSLSGSLTLTAEEIQLGGNITTTAASIVLNGAATLNQRVSIDTGSGVGDVFFNGTVDALQANQQSLSISAGTGNVEFNGRVGELVEPYVEAVEADNTVGYWRLGDAPPILDSSGNALHGSPADGVALGQDGALPGDPDKAVELDGLDDSGYQMRI